MTLIWAALVIVVLGVTAAIAVGRGGGLGANYPDRPDVLLPTGRPLTPEDVEDVEFSVTVRGYRMDEVDEVLRRLRAELAERDERIAFLGPPRHRAPESSPAPPPQPPPGTTPLHAYPTAPGAQPGANSMHPTPNSERDELR